MSSTARQPRRPQGRGNVKILTVVLLYASFAALWILVSDKAFEVIFGLPSTLTIASVLKGWVFVAVTALLLYLVMARLLGPEAAGLEAAARLRVPRLPLLLLLLCVVGLTATGVLLAINDEEEKETARLQAIAELKTHQIANWLDERRGDARVVQGEQLYAETYQSWRAGGEEAAGTLLFRRLGEYARENGFQAALLIDAGGELLWDSTGRIEALPPLLKAAVRDAAGDGGIQRLGPYRDGADRLWLDYVVPLPDVGKGSRPVAVLRLDPAEFLFPLLESWPVPSSTAESLLFRREGDQILFLSPLRHKADAGLRLRAPIDAEELLAAQGLRGARRLGRGLEGVDYRGRPAIGVVQAVPGTNWYLIAKMDLSEVYLASRDDVITIMLAGLLAVFAALAGAVAIRQRQTLAIAAQRRVAERQQLRTLRLFNAVADSVPGLIYSYKLRPDGSDCMPFATPVVEDLFGLTPEQVVDDLSPWHQRVHPDDHTRVTAGIRQAAQGPDRWHDQYRYLHPDKGLRWIEGWSEPIEDADSEEVTDGSVIWHGFLMDVTERKLAENSLREAHERTRSYLDTAQSILVAVDTEGRVTMLNRKGCEVLGYREDELLGRNWFETCLPQPEGMEQVYPVFRGILSGGADASIFEYYENHVQCRDGSRRLVGWHSGALRDDEGRVTGVIAAGEDITERRAGEESLRDSEQRFRQMAETIGDVFWMRSPDSSRFLYISPAFERVWRIPCEALYHNPQLWLDSIHPEDLPRVQAALAQLAEGSSFDLRYRIRRPDGSCRWIQDRGYARRDGDGAVVAVSGVAADVTERMGAEAELQKLSQAVEQSPESVVITDVHGNIEYVNAAFVSNSGYRREEVMGRNPRLLQSGKTPPETYEAMWAALSRGEPWKGMFHNRRRDGSEYVEFAVVTPIRQPDGRVTHYVAVKEDITEKKRIGEELDRHRHHLEELVGERTLQLAEARERAEQANRAKSAFLANMSHEIRTPMNGVLGMLEILDHTELSDYQREVLSTIRDSAKVLLGLIDDILDFSKIEAGRLSLEHAPVAVADLVEGVCNSLVPLADLRDVDLNVFIPPQIPQRLMSDEVRLRQILYNLVGNAIKFSPSEGGRRGQVWVRAEIVDHAPLRLAFHIRDNGIGMSEATRAQLFTAFTQAEVSTTRRFGGTGLGLTICRRLVDMMGGEIAVQSAPGEGSTFTVTLPFEVAPEQPPVEQSTLLGVTCILIRHPDYMAEDLATYLLHAGARAALVEDPRQAAEFLAGVTGPAVVIRYIAQEPPRPAEALADRAQLGHLLIGYGRRRRPRMPAPDIVTLDANGLRRHALLRAVAVAAGREAPAVLQVTPSEQRLDVSARAAAPDISAARSQGRLILVAEDDAVNQKVILQQLALLGYAAEVAGDGAEALRMWRRGGYALLLTDLHMPEMDGYRLAQTIRHEESGPRLPILALTANALHGESGRAEEAGMDDYLTKPVRLQRLREALRRWLPDAGGGKAAQPAAGGDSGRALQEAAAAVDLDELKALVGADEAVINELLSEYLDSLRGLAPDLADAAAEQDAARVGRIAHKLKSASRSVGAAALGDLCAGLENAGRTGDNAAIEAGLAEFEAARARVEAAVEGLLGSP